MIRALLTGNPRHAHPGRGRPGGRGGSGASNDEHCHTSLRHASGSASSAYPVAIAVVGSKITVCGRRRRPTSCVCGWFVPRGGGCVRCVRPWACRRPSWRPARGNQKTVHSLQAGELAGTVEVATLVRAADALGCDVVYALVPRVPLQQACSSDWSSWPWSRPPRSSRRCCSRTSSRSVGASWCSSWPTTWRPFRWHCGVTRRLSWVGLTRRCGPFGALPGLMGKLGESAARVRRICDTGPANLRARRELSRSGDLWCVSWDSQERRRGCDLGSRHCNAVSD
jgi:hypothetical protein